jgi:methionyl-tRNA formyltransferase
MKILIAGTPQIAVTVLDAFLASDHEVVGVLTLPDTTYGRGGEKVRITPLKSGATERGVDVFDFSPNTESGLEQLKKLAPDMIVVVAYGMLIKAEALALQTDGVIKYGWVNLHFSLLPKWRGAAPVQRSIMSGESETGVTIFEIEAGMDTGDVYKQVKYPLDGTETTATLLDNLAEIGAREFVALADSLDEAEGSGAGVSVAAGSGVSGVEVSAVEKYVTKIAQINLPDYSDENAGLIAKKLFREECQISSTLNAYEADRIIRAANPEPFAWVKTAVKGLEEIKLIECKLVELDSRFHGNDSGVDSGFQGNDSSGGNDNAQIIAYSKKLYLSFATDKLIEILELQPAGKKPQSAQQFINGNNQKFPIDIL